MYGCYENISGPGCSTTRALQDLTGGIVQSFGLSNQDRFLTYQVLNSAVPRSSLLISTITLVSVIQPSVTKNYVARFSRTSDSCYDVHKPPICCRRRIRDNWDCGTVWWLSTHTASLVWHEFGVRWAIPRW